MRKRKKKKLPRGSSFSRSSRVRIRRCGLGRALVLRCFLMCCCGRARRRFRQWPVLEWFGWLLLACGYISSDMLENSCGIVSLLLVLLVMMHLVLCFLRLSVSVAIPQVQFLDLVLCLVVASGADGQTAHYCVVSTGAVLGQGRSNFLSWCRGRFPWSSVQKTTFILLLLLYTVIDVPVAQVVQVPLHLTVSSVVFGVRLWSSDYRFSLASGNINVFSTLWFDSGHMLASFYEASASFSTSGAYCLVLGVRLWSTRLRIFLGLRKYLRIQHSLVQQRIHALRQSTVARGIFTQFLREGGLGPWSPHRLVALASLSRRRGFSHGPDYSADH